MTTMADRRRTQSGKIGKGCLIALAIVGGIAILLLGGCFFLVMMGLDEAGSVLVDDFRDHPAVVEHIGEIQEADLKLIETAKRASENPDDAGYMVIKLTGSKGNGEMLLLQEQGSDEVAEAKLVLPDGTEFDLMPDAGAGADAATDEAGTLEEAATDGG